MKEHVSHLTYHKPCIYDQKQFYKFIACLVHHFFHYGYHCSERVGTGNSERVLTLVAGGCKIDLPNEWEVI